MFDQIKNHINLKKLTNQHYAFLFDKYEGDEFVCLNCQTTGYNLDKDEIISIGAVIIKNNTILTSTKFERFILNNISPSIIEKNHIINSNESNTKPIETIIEEFLEFIGNRPIVGYYLDFDMKMINKYTEPIIGTSIPNTQFEVSSLYYDSMIKNAKKTTVDLKFNSIIKELNLPVIGDNNTLNDATMTAMIYLKLQKD